MKAQVQACGGVAGKDLDSCDHKDCDTTKASGPSDHLPPKHGRTDVEQVELSHDYLTPRARPDDAVRG